MTTMVDTWRRSDARAPRCVRATWALAVALSGCAADDGDAAEVWRSFGFASADVVEGRFETLVARMDDGTSRMVHRVHTGDERVALAFDEPPAIAPGSQVRAWGQRGVEGEVAGVDDDRVAVEDFEVLAPPPAPLIGADPFAPRKLALLVLDFGSPDLGIDEAQSRMWDDERSSAAYYAEISYGKESLTGDVLGPYTIGYPGGCDADAIAAYAQQAMADDGVNPNDYQQLMYAFPGIGCGWGGLAMLGAPQQPERDSWYNGQFDCVVRNQEVAHNYGIMHTHFYYGCSGGPFGSGCAYEEYGSPYEPMGYGCGHMAAHQKEYMGWLEGCNSVAASADGTFNLVPLESPCDGIQALRLPTFDGREYYLEYRQPIGFDADDGLAGVLVHVSSTVDYWGPDGYLIDLGEGGFLGVGDSYTDPQGTVTFTVRAQDDTHAEIEVVFPGGGSGEPSCLGGGQPASQAGSYGTLACLGGPFQPDGVPPQVEIAAPDDGAGFEPGDPLTVRVDASDDVGVVQVALYVDDQLQGSLSSPPWEWHFETLLPGDYTLVAVASDGVNEAESAAVSIAVAEGAGDGNDDDGAADSAGGDGGSGVGEDATASGGLDDDPGALPPGFGLDADDGGCACASTRGPRDPRRAWPPALAALLLLARRRARVSGRG